MTYHHQLPAGTLVTCIYDPHRHDKLPYLIAAVVIKANSTRSCWRVLRGGWNHCHNLEDSTYGLPEANDPDYHSFVVHTPNTFPYPELLI